MTARAEIRQHPERTVTDEAAEILAIGMVAHVGFSQDGQPYVIPFSYHFEPEKPDRIYIHGAQSSRTMQHLATGAPTCVTVTLLDGLVYSRTAKYHSMNFRSVVIFGRGRSITDEKEKEELFDRMVRRYIPERTAGQDYEIPPSDHLKATALVEVLIEEWSAKARSGGPKGPRDADPDAAGSAGLVDLKEF